MVEAAGYIGASPRAIHHFSVVKERCPSITKRPHCQTYVNITSFAFPGPMRREEQLVKIRDKIFVVTYAYLEIFKI